MCSGVLEIGEPCLKTQNLYLAIGRRRTSNIGQSCVSNVIHCFEFFCTKYSPSLLSASLGTGNTTPLAGFKALSIFGPQNYISPMHCVFSFLRVPYHSILRRPIPMKIGLTRSACRQTVPPTTKFGFNLVFMFLFLAVCFSRRIKMWIGSPRPVITGLYLPYVITRSRVVSYGVGMPGNGREIRSKPLVCNCGHPSFLTKR